MHTDHYVIPGKILRELCVFISLSAQRCSWLPLRKDQFWVDGGPLYYSQWNNVSSCSWHTVMLLYLWTDKITHMDRSDYTHGQVRLHTCVCTPPPPIVACVCGVRTGCG